MASPSSSGRTSSCPCCRHGPSPSPSPDSETSRVASRSRAEAAAVIAHVIGSLSYAGVLLILLSGSLGVTVPAEIPIVHAVVLSHYDIITWWVARPPFAAGPIVGDVG